MSDIGLPPVGELVQITTTEGRRFLALYSGGPWAHGEFQNIIGDRYLGTEDVRSWSRVLVVPDTDETREAIKSAVRPSIGDDAFAVLRAGCCADAVLAALREAADSPRPGPESAANAGQ